MSWWHLPPELRQRVESLLGEEILDADSQRGGSWLRDRGAARGGRPL